MQKKPISEDGCFKENNKCFSDIFEHDNNEKKNVNCCCVGLQVSVGPKGYTGEAGQRGEAGLTGP